MPASNIKSYIRNPRKFNRDKTCTWEEPGPEAIHAGDWTAGAQPCWKHNNSQGVQQVAQRGLDPALGRSISYRPREVLSYLNYCVTKSDSLLHSNRASLHANCICLHGQITSIKLPCCPGLAFPNTWLVIYRQVQQSSPESEWFFVCIKTKEVVTLISQKWNKGHPRCEAVRVSWLL